MSRRGKRTGSGGKKTAQARTRKRRTPVQAEDVLADPSFDEKKAWVSLLKATTTSTVANKDGKRKQITVPDNRIRLAALKYLTDRRDGKVPSLIYPSAMNKSLAPVEDPRLSEVLEKLLAPASPQTTLAQSRMEVAGAGDGVMGDRG
jgi:hypothetical protein